GHDLGGTPRILRTIRLHRSRVATRFIGREFSGESREYHMTDEAKVIGLSGSNARDVTEQAKGNEPSGSVARISGFLGIVAVIVANVAGIITHVDDMRQFVAKLLGTEWVYRLEVYIVYGALALLLLGYGSLAYWLYRNFFARRTRWIKGGFYVAAFAVVGLMVLGSYALFRPVDFGPLVKKQSSRYAQTVLSQQVTFGEDRGGFRFSQGGISNDTQAWTPDQCLVALLQQDVAIVKEAGANIRQAFEYLERSRLKSPSDGWGYLRNFPWGVTEIDAWVALAYIYSLKVDNAAIVWKQTELREITSKANLAVDLLLKRQHDDGGWAPIVKTSNPKHKRTY